MWADLLKKTPPVGDKGGNWLGGGGNIFFGILNCALGGGGIGRSGSHY